MPRGRAHAVRTEGLLPFPDRLFVPKVFFALGFLSAVCVGCLAVLPCQNLRADTQC